MGQTLAEYIRIMNEEEKISAIDEFLLPWEHRSKFSFGMCQDYLDLCNWCGQASCNAILPGRTQGERTAATACSPRFLDRCAYPPCERRQRLDQPRIPHVLKVRKLPKVQSFQNNAQNYFIHPFFLFQMCPVLHSR